MGLELVAGRPFAEDLGEDRAGSGVLVNEALVRAYGGRPVLGETLNTQFYQGMVVVGVVKDFHFHSLHQPIAPMILAPRTFMAGSVRTILVRIKPTGMPATLALLEQTWQKAVPEAPFKYEFLDDIVGQQYRAEERWGRIVRYAAGFAVLIACFGLFGLAALAAAKRTKEIGIRKVLGASVSSIALLLSKDLVRLVALAFVLAAPLAYAAIGRWLDGFAYRIEPGVGTFAAAGLLVMAFAVGTVAYQSIRAARANPTKTLRYE
jgi:putative ABC transport system permease protein